MDYVYQLFKLSETLCKGGEFTKVGGVLYGFPPLTMGKSKMQIDDTKQWKKTMEEKWHNLLKTQRFGNELQNSQGVL